MKTLPLIILFLLCFSNIAAKDPEPSWLYGGTLHEANAIQWSLSPRYNQSATCSDYLQVTVEGQELIKKFESTGNPYFRYLANVLADCIDYELAKHKMVSDAAIKCMVGMKLNILPEILKKVNE